MPTTISATRWSSSALAIQSRVAAFGPDRGSSAAPSLRSSGSPAKTIPLVIMSTMKKSFSAKPRRTLLGESTLKSNRGCRGPNSCQTASQTVVHGLFGPGRASITTSTSTSLSGCGRP